MSDTRRTEQPLTDTLNEFMAAMRLFAKAYVEQAHRAMTALKPLAEWAKQHPEEVARWELEREQRDAERSCHCLCGTHRAVAEGVCLGTAEPGLTVRFDSPTVGTQHVPMCRPCHDSRTPVATLR